MKKPLINTGKVVIGSQYVPQSHRKVVRGIDGTFQATMPHAGDMSDTEHRLQQALINKPEERRHALVWFAVAVAVVGAWVLIRG